MDHRKRVVLDRPRKNKVLGTKFFTLLGLDAYYCSTQTHTVVVRRHFRAEVNGGVVQGTTEVPHQMIPINLEDVVSGNIVLETIVIQRVDDIGTFKIRKSIAVTKLGVLFNRVKRKKEMAMW